MTLQEDIKGQIDFFSQKAINVILFFAIEIVKAVPNSLIECGGGIPNCYLARLVSN